MVAVITCLIQLETGNGPMVVNTPHITSLQYSEGATAPLLPVGCVEIINELIVQAERYIDGERDVQPDPQMEIDFDQNETTISMSVGNGEFTKPITMTEFTKRTNKIINANK